MKRTTDFGARTRLGVVAVALAAFAACGGGGGGGGPDLIDLTVGNRDAVAHAAGASLVALGASNSIPVLGGPGGVAILRNVARLAREQPMGLISLPPQSCAVSGRARLTLDDQNGNGQLDLAEPVTIVFEACQDNAYDVLNGTVVLTITGDSATSFSATMTMAQLSQEATNSRHGMMLDGSLDLSCALLSSTSMRCTSTANSSVSAALRTHLFSDTVTLQRGFVEDATYDDGTGHTTSTVRGTIHSAAAGGAFSVATDTAIGRLYADPYPHEGRLRVSGDRGTMLVAPQSATQVQIDLDSGNDGTFESSELKDWDWLL
jgi:hypothetical protein